MVVIPCWARRATASATAGSAWPPMAPVSPRQRSTYSTPSTSTSRAPDARATKTGKAPAHRVIQGIGTPASSEPPACSASSRERGCVATKRLSSSARRDVRRAWSTMRAI
jgi:hypothetical protein